MSQWSCLRTNMEGQMDGHCDYYKSSPIFMQGHNKPIHNNTKPNERDVLNLQNSDLIPQKVIHF